MVVLVFRLGSMACESDGPVDAEVSQRLNHTSGGTWVNKKKQKIKKSKNKEEGNPGCVNLQRALSQAWHCFGSHV